MRDAVDGMYYMFCPSMDSLGLLLEEKPEGGKDVLGLAQ
jgi:hypothetical protein